MTRYIIGKTVSYLSLLAGIVIFTFVLFHAVPTDPARVILGANASEQEVAVLRKELGLDKPMAVQLGEYLAHISRLEFGRSYVDDRPVVREVIDKLGISLALISLTLAITFCYVIVMAAVDFLLKSRIGEYLDFFWVSTPSMFSAVFLSLLAVQFYPFTTFSGRLASLADILYLLPPALALALYPMAILSRILRGELRRIEQAPFITAARATGFSEGRILGTYMLRNALVPFLSALGSQIPLLFTGAFIVEVIFSIPGIGSLLVKSLLQRDLPMLKGIVIINGFVVIAVHLGLELLYPVIDPRMASDGT